MPDDKLDRLKKELYARQETEEMQKRQEDISTLGVRRPINTPAPDTSVARERTFINVADRTVQRRKKIIRIVSIIVSIMAIIGLAGAGTWWYRSLRQVKQKQISLEVISPQEVTAGDVVTYEIKYRNDSRVSWNNVEISFLTPRGFLFRESQPAPSVSGKQYIVPVGTVKAQAGGSVKITGQLIGEQNAAILARSEIFLTPENFPAGRFSKAVDVSSTITASPVDVAIDAPKEAGVNGRIVAAIQLRNNGTETVKNLYLKIKTEGQATFAVEDPQFSPDFSVPDSRWLISSLDPLQTVTRQVILYADGRPGEQRKLDIETGIIEQNETFVQRTVSHVFSIAASQLSIEQEYNSSSGNVIVQAGQKVEGKIKYQNIGSSGLKDVLVKAHLEGIPFEPSSLQLTGGAYDAKTKTITWSSATIPDLRLLQPKQSGEITLGFTILATDKFPRAGDTLKNFTLVSTATIDITDPTITVNPEQATASDRLVFSVETDPSLQVDSFYDDGRLGISSSGPVPPVVGQETTYTIRVRVGSTLNDIGEVSFTATLPDGVHYTDKTYKTAGEIRFNERTNEVAWHIPLVSNGTGRIKPAEELYFQVALTPAEHQRGGQVSLINKLTFTGTDEFVDKEVTVDSAEQNLPSTESASPGQGSVQ